MQAPMAPKDPKSHPPAAAERPPAACGTPRVDSESLFQGKDEVVIRHGGKEYRLRRTRLGKLILTA